MSTKRMFEFVEGSSSKFWEVWVEGSVVHTHYGRIGASGQTTIKDEGSPEKATRLHDKLVAEKTKKGYREVGASGATPAATEVSDPGPDKPAKARPAKAKSEKATSAKGKEAGKLPAALKVPVYADVLAASAELIVAGSTSAGELAAWSAAGGVVKIANSFQEGLEWRTGPAQGGLAVLPGGRFLMAAGKNLHPDGRELPSCVGVFGLDGALVGKPVSEEGREYDASASSPAGDLVAVASAKDGKGRLSLWRTDDLVSGGRPLRDVEGPFLSSLAFTPDGKTLVWLSQNKLCILPVAGGPVRELAVELEVETGLVTSVADDGTVCVSDSKRASVVSLEGKKLLGFESPNGGPVGTVVEHALITPDGTLVAAAGDIAKHYARDWAQRATFPDPEMARGFVALFDRQGKLLHWVPRAKKLPVRALALAPGRAVVVGQDSFAELVPWPG